MYCIISVENRGGHLGKYSQMFSSSSSLLELTPWPTNMLKEKTKASWSQKQIYGSVCVV